MMSLTLADWTDIAKMARPAVLLEADRPGVARHYQRRNAINFRIGSPTSDPAR